MSSKEAMFSTTLRRFGDKLIYKNPAEESLYKTFINSLEEGHVVHVFFDAAKDDGTLSQLAKIKACIREIAKETGTTFEDAQLQVKIKTGLCVRKNIDGETYMVCKSFADASKAEMSLTIETIVQMGEFLGINFR